MKHEPETMGDLVWIHAHEKYGSQTKAAAAYGVSASFFNSICKGIRRPTKEILDDMGWTLAYVPKSSLQCEWQEVGRKAA